MSLDHNPPPRLSFIATTATATRQKKKGNPKGDKKERKKVKKRESLSKKRPDYACFCLLKVF